HWPGPEAQAARGPGRDTASATCLPPSLESEYPRGSASRGARELGNLPRAVAVLARANGMGSAVSLHREVPSRCDIRTTDTALRRAVGLIAAAVPPAHVHQRHRPLYDGHMNFGKL